MVQFRLLDLPIVVLRRFVKINQNFINFALCNSKCYQLVREAKLEADQIQVWQLGLEPSFCIDAYKLRYEINNLSERNESDIKSFGKITLRNHPVWMTDDTFYWDMYSEDTVKTFGIFMDFVNSIIASPIEYWIEIMPNFREHYLRNVVKNNVRRVVVFGEHTCTCTRGKPPVPIPGDIMEFILDETPSHVRLDIGTPPETGFVYPKKLKKFAKFTMEFPEGATMETVFVNGIDEEYYRELQIDENSSPPYNIFKYVLR